MLHPYLTPAEQLVVGGGGPSDAVALWHQLHHVYLRHRGFDPNAPAVESIPATIHTDALDLVNAFEKLIAPILPRLVAVEHGALWLAWRRAYAHVLETVTAAPDLRARFPDNRALWLGMLDSMARALSALAPPSSSIARRP